MPFYDYLCHECGHEFTEMRKIADRAIPENQPCPSCGQQKILQKINAPGFSDSIKLGLQKPSREFQDLMKHIHKKAPGSQLDKTSNIVSV